MLHTFESGVSGFFALPELERPICISAFFLPLSSSADVHAKAVSSCIPTSAKLVLGCRTLSAEGLLSLPRLGRKDWTPVVTSPFRPSLLSPQAHGQQTQAPCWARSVQGQQQTRGAEWQSEQVSTRRRCQDKLSGRGFGGAGLMDR